MEDTIPWDVHMIAPAVVFATAAATPPGRGRGDVARRRGALAACTFAHVRDGIGVKRSMCE